jgi:hypothetical protein
MRRRDFMLGGALAVLATRARAERASGVLYKTPGCECCDQHAAYLRDSGIALEIVETAELPTIKARYGVPAALEGCHSIVLNGYVIEGHVPIAPIRRLLAERPNIKGISLPGMPEGSPGMAGRKTQPFTILEIAEGEPRVFAVE